MAMKKTSKQVSKEAGNRSGPLLRNPKRTGPIPRSKVTPVTAPASGVKVRMYRQGLGIVSSRL